MRLVLASASPQRRALLEGLDVAFEVRPVDVDELTTGPPAGVAACNARLKALARPLIAGEIVLGADTVVALDGEVFGKPADAAEARRMLARLAGREHEVHSAVALARVDGPMWERATVTTVRFRALAGEEIDRYVACGEWAGRAGGYAIQGRGALLVERVEGDYPGVVGLPVSVLGELLRELLERP